MPIAPRRLTKALVDGLKPAAKSYFLWDTELKGFGVRVYASGKRSFVLKYQCGGKKGVTKRITIGDMPSMGVDAARKIAAELRVQVHRGVDPMLERRAKRTAAAAENRKATVADLFDAYLLEVQAKNRPRTFAEYERLMGTPIAKLGKAKGTPRAGELRRALGTKRVAEVTAADVGALHRRMASRPVLANRCLAILKRTFHFAERQGWRAKGSNPCVDIATYREHARERFLSDAEYAALGTALRKAEREGLPLPPSLAVRKFKEQTEKHRAKSTAGRLAPPNPMAVAALRFLLLTGWRKSECIQLRWEYLDRERSQATLPSSKTGRSVRDIGATVWLLLDEVRAMTGGGKRGFVFPGMRADSSYQGLKRVWTAVRYAAGLTDVRAHDLRHSAASVGAANGLSLPLIGALLGHLDQASTQRYIHLADSARMRAVNLVSASIAQALAERKEAPAQDERAEEDVRPISRPA